MPEKLVRNLFIVALLGAVSVAQTPLTANASERTASSPSLAAAGATGWDNLKQLTPDQEAKVLLSSGESYQGKLQSVSDDALVIHSGKSEQTFTRDRVRRVSIQHRGHRGRNALLSGAIGAGAGLGLGAFVDRCAPSDFICTGNRGKAIVTPLFGLIGAGIGALISRGGWEEAYRSR